MTKPSDADIRRRWGEIARLYNRVGYRRSRLGRTIALALADRLEAEGVTEADIDRLTCAAEAEAA